MNNYINQTPNMSMYNGYNNYRLPTYEVIKVNGRGGTVNRYFPFVYDVCSG